MAPRLSHALDAVRFARAYSLGLIDSFPEADWFRMPAGGVTHLAWQVGHLAMAQYRLCVERVRGVRPEDSEVIAPHLVGLFLRDSVPNPDPAKYPNPAELRRVLDRVHGWVLEILTGWPDADLDTPVLTAHRFCKTKLDCVRWCSAHEMLHAGQIGLLRRLLGHPPQW